MNEKILLLEDDQALGMILSERFRREGYQVEIVSNGERPFPQASDQSFDLIILDTTLSGLSRIEVCRDIREAGLTNPVLVLIARGQTAQTVLALNLGADDCVQEPLEISEVVARIEGLLRRMPLRRTVDVHHVGAICIDITGWKVTREGKPVFLLRREFELLRYFVQHACLPLTRDEILREVWGYEAGTLTRTVDVHVAELRRKLERDPKRPELILTVPGIGYEFGLT
jgi:DNA-binding response OmpR family regulator